MNSLTEFLLARIAEDEAHVDPEYHSFRKTDFVNVEQGAQPTCWVMLPGNRTCILPDGHMGDPARVLAECEAKRRIVELHAPDRLEPDICSVCASHAEEWPCRTLRLLALPYAGHAAYEERWKP